MASPHPALATLRDRFPDNADSQLKSMVESAAGINLRLIWIADR